MKKVTMVGRAFHTTVPGSLGQRTKWQGEIIADLGDGKYLAQLYGWVMGEPTTQIVLTAEQMAQEHPGEGGAKVFRLFDTMEDANNYYVSNRQRDEDWDKEQGKGLN